MSGLPRVKIVVRQIADPSWVGEYVGNKAINMDTYYLHNVEMEVEVLTVHFAKNTMRVRLPAGYNIKSLDVDATPFFDQLKLVAK